MKPSDDKLDELLEQHAAEARDLRLSALPKKDEVPEHRFSRRFERNMKRLRAEQRRTPRANNILRYARRAAAVAAILLCVCGLAYVAHNILFDSTSTTGDASLGSDMGGAVAEFPAVSFGYLPEGMEQTVCTTDETGTQRFTQYARVRGALVELLEAPVSGTDETPSGTEQLTVCGAPAYLSESNDTVCITWTLHDISYTLTTQNLSTDEARKIALGIEIE